VRTGLLPRFRRALACKILARTASRKSLLKPLRFELIEEAALGLEDDPVVDVIDPHLISLWKQHCEGCGVLASLNGDDHHLRILFDELGCFQIAGHGNVGTSRQHLLIIPRWGRNLDMILDFEKHLRPLLLHGSQRHSYSHVRVIEILPTVVLAFVLVQHQRHVLNREIGQ